MESRPAMKPLDAVVIGSGNVVSAIVPALERVGAIRVKQVFSPTPGHAERMADRLTEATAITDVADVADDAEVYLLAVKDDAIAELARTLKPNRRAVWLHTSGGVEAATLAPLSPHYGVVYPLQTFSQGVNVDLSEVPVFIEGADEMTVATARRMAEAISPKVNYATASQRATLHAAAVFACNFTNHFWAIADDILHRENNVGLEVLYPLLRETMRKAMSMRPADGQTGPARRGDRGVIEKHKSLLAPDEARLYETLSQHIMDYYERD